MQTPRICPLDGLELPADELDAHTRRAHGIPLSQLEALEPHPPTSIFDWPNHTARVFAGELTVEDLLKAIQKTAETPPAPADPPERTAEDRQAMRPGGYL